jgi:outer membrane protein assembly factor BamD (BamD/ComL family)
MSRWPAALFCLGVMCFAQEKQHQKPEQPPAQQEQEPPEEDEGLKTKVYTFNPLQAAKEVKVGDFYMRKGSYRAAVQRYREATRWNQELAEAWLKLAEAAEKQKDAKTIREAYARYLELVPDAKNASEIRKKLK